MIITVPENVGDISVVLANMVFLGFVLAFSIYSSGFVASAFRKFVDDSIKK